MRFIKFKLPEDLKDYKARKVVSLPSIGEGYIVYDKPKKRRR